MKKQLVIAASVLSSVIVTSGVAHADYPPSSECKPSASVLVSALRNASPSRLRIVRQLTLDVPAGTTKPVNIFKNDSLTVVISGMGQDQKYSIMVKAPGGRNYINPCAAESSNKKLRLPTITFNAAGVYTLTVTPKTGAIRSILITVQN